MPDLAALCAAIDAGDDSALLPLTDLLEEIGDPRAAVLRGSLPHEQPLRGPNSWVIESRFLPRRVWGRLGGGSGVTNNLPEPDGGHPGGLIRHYPTRSAAYLALAEALTVTAPSSPLEIDR